MVSFKRGQDSKKALNIGSEKYYRDLWEKRIDPEKDKLNWFVNNKLPTWHSTEMDFEDGYWKIWGQGENMLAGDLLLKLHIDEVIKLIDEITLPIPF